MITDENIEDNSKYWCVLTDNSIQKVLDQLLAKYQAGKDKAEKEMQNADDSKLNEGSNFRRSIVHGLDIIGIGVKKLAGGSVRLARSWPVKTGLKIGGGTLAVGLLGGYGIKKGAELTADGVARIRREFYGMSVQEQHEWIKKLESSDDPTDQWCVQNLKREIEANNGRLRNGGNPDGWNGEQFMKDLKDGLKTVGIAAACIGGIYAVWKCRGIISSLFSSTANKVKQAADWIKRGKEVAKCQFTSDGTEYECVLDANTCKWSLLSSSKPSSDDQKSYANTKHFKKFSGACLNAFEKYLSDESFQMIANAVQIAAEIPEEAKEFFKNVAKNRKMLIQNVKNNAWN